MREADVDLRLESLNRLLMGEVEGFLDDRVNRTVGVRAPRIPT